MKRIFWVSLLVVFALVLTACQLDENKTSEQVSKETKADNHVVNEEDNVEEAKKENVTVENDEFGEEGQAETFYADALIDHTYMASEEQLELDDASYQFVVDNFKLFPAKDKSSIDEVIKISEPIDSRELMKNPTKHLENILKVDGYVVQIYEEDIDDETVTFATVYDDLGYAHVILMYKDSEGIYEGDDITFYGIPLGGYSFEANDGGFQNAILYFVSHVEKK